MTNTHYLTIVECARRMDAGEFSSFELVQDALERADRFNGELGAFLRTTPELALEQAQRADDRRARGEAGPLTGIPVAIKDILSTRDVVTTCGSRILEDYVPKYTATAVQRLFDAGAVLLGKTNMDEFAMGSSTENSGFYPTRNPWNTSRVPGGSSGGSAAAVAAGIVPVALGTDTGGSVRQPAALTGTVGLKPTYGRVSRHGLVAFGSSLDQVGPLARTVEDSALVLQTMAGRDPLDSTSVDAPVPRYSDALREDLEGVRIGVPREYLGEGLDPDVKRAVMDALGVMETLGATVDEVSLPHSDYALSAYYIIAPAEAMANLARYDGVRYGVSVPGDDIWETFARTREVGFGREVKRRILLGTYALSAGYYEAYYLKAQKVRTLVRRDFEKAFEQVDVLVGPSTPTTAFPLGEKLADPLQMYLNDVYTVPANIAGICGISVPAGFGAGLPIGVQVLGRPLGEAEILRVGHAFQCATDYHLRRPPLGEAAAR